MRRWGMGKWGLAGCLALSATVGLAAEPDDDYPAAAEAAAAGRSMPSQRPGLLDYVFGTAQRPSKPAPAAKSAKPAKPKPEAAKAEPAKADEKPAASAADREQEAYLRRLAVCDRLREVADETKDEKLRQLADHLQDRAWELCVQRANLDASALDDTVLSKHLGTDAAPPLPARSTAAAKGDRGNQARLKENLP